VFVCWSRTWVLQKWLSNGDATKGESSRPKKPFLIWDAHCKLLPSGNYNWPFNCTEYRVKTSTAATVPIILSTSDTTECHIKKISLCDVAFLSKSFDHLFLLRSPSPRRRSRSFGRPTVSSLFRSRSISPGLVNRTRDICLSDTDISPAEDRPPFVVRKVCLLSDFRTKTLLYILVDYKLCTWLSNLINYIDSYRMCAHLFVGWSFHFLPSKSDEMAYSQISFLLVLTSSLEGCKVLWCVWLFLCLFVCMSIHPLT